MGSRQGHAVTDSAHDLIGHMQIKFTNGIMLMDYVRDWRFVCEAKKNDSDCDAMKQD